MPPTEPTQHPDLDDTATRQGNQSLRTLLDGMPAIAFIKDREGRMKLLNAFARRAMAPAGEELLGRTGFEILPRDLAEQYEANDQAAIRAGRATQFEEKGLLAGKPTTFLVVKTPLYGADGERTGLGVICIDNTEKKQAEQALRRFVSASPAVIYAVALAPTAIELAWVSDNLTRFSGYSAEETEGLSWWVDHIHPEDRQRVPGLEVDPETLDGATIEFRFRRKDGDYIWVRDEKRLLRDATGRPTEIVGSWTDVTERVALEDQLRRAQKLDAVGRLAGGVAHDFNNLLTIITGSSELLSRALPAAAAEQALVREIQEACRRAASLTRQLLAFGRSQVLSPRILDVNAALSTALAMLRRLIREDIEVVCELSPDAGAARIDPGQFEQVIVNLAMNASEAMPGGGRLTVRTAAVTLDTEAAGARHVAPGRYVRLAVSDTGAGMTPEVQEHVFEPFFSTKEERRGAGLGLATTFGIVHQSGGWIEAASQPGAGSTFTLHLPQVDSESPAAGRDTAPLPATAPATGRGPTVLVVEDEDVLRRLLGTALRGAGYEVLTAPNGKAGLDLAAAHDGPIEMVVTDVVMPEMSGPSMVERLRERRPQVRVLFISGHVEDARMRSGFASGQEAFLQKPFSLSELQATVGTLLAAR